MLTHSLPGPCARLPLNTVELGIRSALDELDDGLGAVLALKSERHLLPEVERNLSAR